MPGGVVHEGAGWAGGTQRPSLSAATFAAPGKHIHTHGAWELHVAWLCSSPMTSGGDAEQLKRGDRGQGASKGTHLNPPAPLLQHRHLRAQGWSLSPPLVIETGRFMLPH